MKKIALVSAIALASISAAHAAPTVYGKVFLTGDYMDSDYDENYLVNKGTTSAPNWVNPQDDSAFKLNSNASRIGFKGEESLTDTTNLVYQLEYGVTPDNSDTQFTSRNTYIGLAHNTLGTLIAGRHDTPFKLAKGNVDVFNANAATLSLENSGVMGETRANNVIAYKSPTLVGMPLTFMAAVVLSEKDDNDGVTTYPNTNEKVDNKDNAYSASLAYDQNGVYLAAAYDNNVGTSFGPVLDGRKYVEDSAWRLAGTFDMGKMNMVQGLTLGALYQQADVYGYSDDSESWLISGKYKIANTPWTAKAQYINTDFGDNDSSEVAVGGEYAFNKSTTGHIYAGQVKADNFKDVTIVGTGIEYKF